MPPGSFAAPAVFQSLGYKPWNIQYFRSGPGGAGRLWIAFSLLEDPWEEDPDFGVVAEYDLDGNYIRRLQTSLDIDPYADMELRDPWGIAFAPANFGPLSGMILVANFGDGTIPAFDPQTGAFVDFVRDASGEPMVVDGIWGITFGNGVGLGDTNALYYAAGPNGEVDGTFGTVRFTPDTCPRIAHQPVSALVCSAAGSATFTVSAPGPTRQSSQWQVESTPGVWTDLVDGPVPGVGSIAGATSPAVVINGPVASTTLRCLISNECGTVLSDAVTLTVHVGLSGDVNADGEIDSADVQGFVRELFAGPVAAASPGRCAADMNSDGQVDGIDRDLFVAAMLAP
jgi:hypothetical protein